MLLATFVAGGALEDGIEAVPAVVYRPKRQAVGNRPDREVQLG